MLVDRYPIRPRYVISVLVDTSIRSLGFYLTHILMFVALDAKTKVNRIFGSTIRSMPDVIALTIPASEKSGVNHVVAAHAISPPITWAAATKFRFSFTDDLASTNFCLAY